MPHPLRTWAFLAALMGSALVALADGSPPAATQPAAPAAGTPQAVVAAARKVCDLIEQQEDAGAPITPSFVHIAWEWSWRWAEANDDAAFPHEQRVAAWETHLRRMRDLRHIIETRLVSGPGPSPFSMAEIDYFIAEAELRLARARGR